MFYTEYLRIRNGVRLSTIVLVIIAAIITVPLVWPGVTFDDSPAPTHHTGAHKGGVHVSTVGDPPVAVVVEENGSKPASAKRLPPPVGDVMLATLLFAVFFVAIFGTARGSSLSAENRRHLPLVWTRPLSRVRYAIGVFAYNLGGMLVMDAICVALTGAAAAIILADHHIALEPKINVPAIAAIAIMSLAFAFAWFGIVEAATASLRERSGVVTGLMWPAAIVLAFLQQTISLAPLHALLRIVNMVNPISYAHISISNEHITPSSQLYAQDAALAALGIAGCALAAWQWQRMEG